MCSRKITIHILIEIWVRLSAVNPITYSWPCDDKFTGFLISCRGRMTMWWGLQHYGLSYAAWSACCIYGSILSLKLPSCSILLLPRLWCHIWIPSGLIGIHVCLSTWQFYSFPHFLQYESRRGRRLYLRHYGNRVRSSQKDTFNP